MAEVDLHGVVFSVRETMMGYPNKAFRIEVLRDDGIDVVGSAREGDADPRPCAQLVQELRKVRGPDVQAGAFVQRVDDQQRAMTGHLSRGRQGAKEFVRRAVQVELA